MGVPPRSRSAGGTIKRRATVSVAAAALRFMGDKKKEPKDLFRLFLG